MSQPYNRTNEDRRKAVTGFLGAVLGSPAGQVANPLAGIPNLAGMIGSQFTPVGQTISPQQAEIRQRRDQNLQGRQHVQQWIDSMRQTGLVDPNNPNPPAGVDKAAARGQIPVMGNALNVAQNIKQQAQPQGQPGQPQGFTGGSFQNMITQAAQQQADGKELPFQDLSGADPEGIQRSFNRGSPGQGTTRLTDWDTEMPYRVVSQLSQEDYADLQSITDKDELVMTAADTVLNVLEDQGMVIPEDFEARFKGGIGAAMDDWYQKRVAEGGSRQMTDFITGMTQVAAALLGPDITTQSNVATTGDPTGAQIPHTGMTINPGDPGAEMIAAPGPADLNAENFIAMYQAGQVPPEFIAGFNAAVAANPNLTLEGYLRGER